MRRAVLGKGGSFLATVSVFALAPAADAQVPYASTSQAAIYTPLVGASDVALVFDEDDGHALLPIGFDFEHYGVTYDHVNVSVNGVLNFVTDCALGCGFDEVCSASGVCTRAPLEPYPYNPPGLPSAQPPNRVVAAFWDDLVFDALSPPLSQMRYATLGTAPNRRFVVEWGELRRLVGNGPGTARSSFQIELHEGTDHIVIHYGPAVAGTGTWSGFVGVENANGTEAFSPLTCGAVSPGCDFAALVSLVNRRYELFVPDLPELAAVLAPPTGGMPGTTFTLPFELSNVGRQDVTDGFEVEAYLSTDLTIGPGDAFIGSLRIEGGLVVGTPLASSLEALIPANLPVGVYRLGFVIDANDEVIEGNENNNVVVHSQQFLVGAELSIRFAPVTPIGVGETQPISVFLLNSGAAQPDVAYAVYLSTDRVLDAQDALLASGALAVDSVPETELILNVTVPNVPSGRYYLIGEIDPAQSIPEINEANNRVASGAFLIGPDFRISAEGPPTTGAGATDTFQVAIRNDGSAAPPVVWRLYLAEANTPGPNDLLIYEGNANLIGAQGLNQTVTATIPSNALGSYSLIAIVDPDGLVDEVDETNNRSVVPTTIVVQGPDLVPGWVRGAPVAFADQPYAVEVEIRNQGRSAATSFYYSIHLSTNRLITFNDPLLAEIGPVSLAAGEVMQRRWVLSLPANLPRGPYVLGLIADWTTLVPEDDETNNVVVFPEIDGFVTVRDPAPDLSAHRVLGPPAAAAGEAFTASRVLENRGNAAGIFNYDIYLSRGTNLDASSRRVGSGSLSLDALEQHAGVDTVRAPSDLEPAQYYLIYDLDPTNALDELDELNNQRASDGALTLEPGPLQILNGALPVATLLLPYHVGLGARGGTGRYTWSLVSGSWPAGLSLDGVSGIVSGVPSELGAHGIRIRVSDGSAEAERDFNLLVAEPTGELVFATRSLPPFFVGRPIRLPLLALGGVPPLRFTVDPALPTGLSLSEDGVLSGTPLARHEELFAFQVRDAAGAVASSLMPLHVLTVAESLHFDVVPLPDGLLGQRYDAPVLAQAGAPPYEFELVEGSLPSGLQLANGRLQGLPDRVETAVFRLVVRDARHDQASAIFVVHIEPSGQIGFLTTALPKARVGESYLEPDARAIRVRALSGSGTGTVSYSLAAGVLPPGLTLEQSGRIFGTPERAGLFSFATLATDDTGTQAVRAFGILVEDPNAIDNGDDAGGCGCRSTGLSNEMPWTLLFLASVFFFRRRRPSPLACLVLLAWPASSWAQAGYVFEEAPSPFVERIGGTVLSFADDDDGQATIALPFSFHLLGRAHSQLTVSTNGYVTFEGSGLAYSNDDIPDPRAPNALLAPFWDDLVVSPGSVSLHVEGRAPGRVAIIQYASLRRFRSFGASFAMQLFLYEGAAGRFAMHYGTPFGVTPSEPFSGSIGLEASGGLEGVVLRGCTPFCDADDLLALTELRLSGHGPGELDVLPSRLDAPVRAVIGAPFALPIALRSEHADPIGPFRYRVYLVAPFELQPSRVVYEGTVLLGPYEELALAPIITLSSSVSRGRYQLALELDPTLELNEVDRANNLLWSEGELEVVPPEPDLSALEVSASRIRARTGEAIQVIARVQNRGTLAASAAWEVSLSNNRVISSDDLVLRSGQVDLAPGETATITVDATIPITTPGGRYFVGVALDPDERIHEENEQNNRRASASALVIDAGGLEITTAVLPDAIEGHDYFGFLSAAGGDGQYDWQISSGALPPGLSLLRASGELRGLAERTGRYEFVAQVSSGGASVTRTLRLEVVAAGGVLTIITRNLPAAVVGQPYPDPAAGPAQLEVAGAQGAVSFALSGTVSAGLRLSNQGAFSGTPPAAGDFLLRVEARDAQSSTSRLIPLTVLEPGRLALISRVLPAARLGSAYHVPLEVFGVIEGSTLAFSIFGGPGMLPPGLALTPEGLFVGVPERVGQWAFVAEVYEVARTTTDFDSGIFFLEVESDEGFAITPTTLPPARVGQPYELRFGAVGGRAPYVWRLVGEGQLPSGMRVAVDQGGEEETLVLEGTPRVVPDAPGGLFPFLLEVTDAQGRHAEQPLSVRVLAEDEGLEGAEDGCNCRTVPDSPVGGTILIFALLALFRRRNRVFLG